MIIGLLCYLFCLSPYEYITQLKVQKFLPVLKEKSASFSKHPMSQKAQRSSYGASDVAFDQKRLSRTGNSTVCL